MKVVCDNGQCDWAEEIDPTRITEWLDKPCPKCNGVQPIITQQEIEAFEAMLFLERMGAITFDPDGDVPLSDGDDLVTARFTTQRQEDGSSVVAIDNIEAVDEDGPTAQLIKFLDDPATGELTDDEIEARVKGFVDTCVSSGLVESIGRAEAALKGMTINIDPDDTVH